MKNYKLAVIKIFTVVVAVLFYVGDLMAQVGPPGGGQNIPLDPLSWILLAAGGTYAVKKYKDNK